MLLLFLFWQRFCTIFFNFCLIAVFVCVCVASSNSHQNLVPQLNIVYFLDKCKRMTEKKDFFFSLVLNKLFLFSSTDDVYTHKSNRCPFHIDLNGQIFVLYHSWTNNICIYIYFTDKTSSFTFRFLLCFFFVYSLFTEFNSTFLHVYIYILFFFLHKHNIMISTLWSSGPLEVEWKYKLFRNLL